MSDSFDNVAIDILGRIITGGGELVSSEQYRQRLEVCTKCPNAGDVTPLPGITVQGCTLCGCPFRTKLKTKTHLKKLKRVITKCPHPDGNKWETIDKIF